MSLISRVWNAIRTPVRYVGRDFEGNTYHETRSLNDPARMKRTVRYSDPDDMWKYVGGTKRLPIQWSSWLTHTRRLPPTLEELEADLIRQQRVLANAARIEARDKAEAEQRLYLRQQGTKLAIEAAAASHTLVNHVGPDLHPASDRVVSAATPPVQPPAFLTPSSPRRTRSNAPFSLPSTDENLPCESARAEGHNSPSPWVTGSTEMESWAPQARRRG